MCFRVGDHAGNVAYAVSAHPLNIDITLPPVPAVVSVAGDGTAPYLTNDATPAVIISGENGTTMSVS